MAPRIALALAVVLTACSKPPELTDIGPRLVSNQTSQPLALVGKNFKEGMQLELGPPFSRKFLVTSLDATHAYVRLPADLTISAGSDAQAVTVTLVGAKVAAQPLRLRVVNDAAFPDLTALAVGDGGVFAASGTTDTIYRYDVAEGTVEALPGGDGPSALAVFAESDGAKRLVIAHQFEPTVWICDGASGKKLRELPAPAYASAVAIDGDGVIVAEQARDTVSKIGLADGAVRWTTSVDP
ncbi:MAG TPA: MtsA protein, partial [Myxococcota bacterium]|nr:MtsA protein [Myxococcota bacterium]